MSTRIPIAFALAFVVSAGPMYAGGSAEQPRASKTVSVVLVVRSPDDAARAVEQGARQAAKDLGNVEVTLEAPDAPTDAAQGLLLERLGSRPMNAIVIMPSEAGTRIDHLMGALFKFQDAGVSVVSLDQKIGVGTHILDVTSATERDEGRALARMISSQTGDRGEIGILGASPDSDAQNALIGAVRKELAAHPAMHLDAILYGNAAPDQAARNVGSLLKAYPRISGLIAVTQNGLAAASQAVKDGGLGGRVQVTGLGTPAVMQPYLDDGTCGQMIADGLIDAGHAATCVAVLLARGRIKGALGEKMSVGRIGTIAMDQTGRVAVSQPTVITRDTIASFAKAASN